MVAPRKYDRAKLVPAICARLATGEPLSLIVHEFGLPITTLDHWRQEDPEIAAQFNWARDVGYDVLAWRTHLRSRGLDENGKPRSGKDTTIQVLRDRLACEVDEKLRAKWDPRRYGEKQQIEHSGSLTLEQLVAASQS